MKIYFLSVFLFAAVSISTAFAQSKSRKQDSTRIELVNLLKERKILFDAYSSSLEKKSGIFGNKTKNDLKSSQSRLVEIVAIDNRIMNTLNRMLDFRNFEKMNMSYDVHGFEDRIKNLKLVNETLVRQNNALEKQNKDYFSSIKRQRIYNLILILLLILTAGLLVRKIFKSN